MLYMYHVHVIVYANKDDDDDYYYYSIIFLWVISKLLRNTFMDISTVFFLLNELFDCVLNPFAPDLYGCRRNFKMFLNYVLIIL